MPKDNIFLASYLSRIGRSCFYIEGSSNGCWTACPKVNEGAALTPPSCFTVLGGCLASESRNLFAGAMNDAVQAMVVNYVTRSSGVEDTLGGRCSGTRKW